MAGKLHAEVDDNDLARAFLREAAELRGRVADLRRDVAKDAELIFAAHAQASFKRGTGRLARGISSTITGDAVYVRADAKNPKTGYDYVGVTRFGHRAQWIVPNPDRAPASVIATGGARGGSKGKYRAPLAGIGIRWVEPRPALKTPFGYFSRVRGFKPKSDWAADALPDVVEESNATMASLGRGFLARLT